MKTAGLKTNFVLSTGYRVLALILPLITAPYTARVLGADGIGAYSYTHSYLMYFSIFAALGTVSYGSREIARHRNDRAARSQLFWEIAILTIITSAVCILAWGAWTLLHRQYRLYYLILTVALIGTMFDISWLYEGLEQFKYTIAQNLLFKVLGTVSIFLFVKKPEDLWKYILIVNLSQMLGHVSVWIYLPKFVDPVPLRGIRLKKHFHETLVYFVPTIAISVYTILDKTLIGLITRDTSENGNYEQATKIVDIAKTLSYVGINAVLHSRISYLFAEKRFEEIKRSIDVSLDYVILISVGFAFGIIGVADRFVPMYFGGGYDKTVTLLRLMSPLVLIVGISNCLGSQYYNPTGLRARSARYIIAGAVLNLCLNLVLIPPFKSVGAVLATVLAEGTISALYMINCDGYYTFARLLRQLWKRLLAGAVMLAAVMLIGRRIENGIVAFLTQAACGAAVYFLTLIALRDAFLFTNVLPFLARLCGRLKKEKER